jgi:hypothetical protein
MRFVGPGSFLLVAMVIDKPVSFGASFFHFEV